MVFLVLVLHSYCYCIVGVAFAWAMPFSFLGKVKAFDRVFCMLVYEIVGYKDSAPMLQCPGLAR